MLAWQQYKGATKVRPQTWTGGSASRLSALIGSLGMTLACICWCDIAGKVAQLEPHVERLQQRSEDLRAELQATKQDNASLNQQVAEMEAAAAMHLAHQVMPLASRSCRAEAHQPVCCSG